MHFLKASMAQFCRAVDCKTCMSEHRFFTGGSIFFKPFWTFFFASEFEVQRSIYVKIPFRKISKSVHIAKFLVVLCLNILAFCIQFYYMLSYCGFFQLIIFQVLPAILAYATKCALSQKLFMFLVF